ncbi:hypothetical protein TWF481_002863 [Arthrobotrys musiformis]|uniref:C2H2-type domain-containing protein n=1 Tax=Arthrobotrys musiformis TaxID=47236 RepID=A0AAV9VUC6_9PEZI
MGWGESKEAYDDTENAYFAAMERAEDATVSQQGFWEIVDAYFGENDEEEEEEEEEDGFYAEQAQADFAQEEEFGWFAMEMSAEEEEYENLGWQQVLARIESGEVEEETFSENEETEETENGEKEDVEFGYVVNVVEPKPLGYDYSEKVTGTANFMKEVRKKKTHLSIPDVYKENNDGFQCKACGEKFKSKTKLHQHISEKSHYMKTISASQNTRTRIIPSGSRGVFFLHTTIVERTSQRVVQGLEQAHNRHKSRSLCA